jgi:hypothetical protein
VVDAQDLEEVGVVIDGTQDPAEAASGAVGALELPLDRLPDATREGSQVTERQFNDHGHDAR